MITIEEVEREAEACANNMTVEMIILLLDKWENELQSMEIRGAEGVSNLLNYYVKLKVSLHHLSKAWYQGWMHAPANECEFKLKYKTLHDKVQEARRNYYVARRKFREQEHGARCACRGCRCIKGIASTRQE